MIKKYRKKPVEIEAMEFTSDPYSSLEIYEWAIEYGCKITIVVNPSPSIYLDITMKIPTLEGDHIATVGDYIIKGVKNEFYPCKPEIFEMTYEEVKE